MNKIKLRGWSDYCKRMFYPSSDYNLVFDDTQCNVLIYSQSGELIDTAIVIPMLCSGMKDISSRDIYDGDIIKYHFFQEYDSIFEDYVPIDEYKIGIVDFDIKTASFHILGDVYTPNMSNICIDSFEILGNIYENPQELLLVKSDGNNNESSSN